MKSTPLTADDHTDRIAKFRGLKKGTNVWDRPPRIRRGGRPGARADPGILRIPDPTSRALRPDRLGTRHRPNAPETLLAPRIGASMVDLSRRGRAAVSLVRGASATGPCLTALFGNSALHEGRKVRHGTVPLAWGIGMPYGRARGISAPSSLFISSRACLQRKQPRGRPMKKHLLLVTGPLDESQVPQFLAALRRAAGSVRIQEVGGRRANEQRPLTPRQLQVLRAIASGNTVGEIAAFLKISRKTVETHRQKNHRAPRNPPSGGPRAVLPEARDCPGHLAAEVMIWT